MRKFLSLLLAAVLICSTVLLPASAEVMNEQDLAVAAIENEIQSLQPRAVGDQTTYHICQEADGQVLMNGGGNMLFKGNFNASSISQQWLFEEFGDYSAYFGVYYIRYAGNPSYVLGAKQSTGEVALVPFTTTDYCIYWVIYTTSNGTYICPDYNLNSSGDGYLCMSTSYPYTFSISSSPTENCKMLLISPSVTQVTSLYLANSNIKLPVGNTGSAVPNIFPESAAYNSVDWLVYTSSNSSVCVVDQNGTITGISDGTATVTVKHKIFGVPTTCTVTVVTPIQLNGYRLLCDDATANSISGTVLQGYYNDAVAGIFEEFDVSFGNPSNVEVSEHLNLNSDCTASGEVCSENCGALSQCSILPHHKNSGRIRSIDSIGTAKTMRFVEYVMCAYNAGNPSQHFEVLGVTGAISHEIAISSYYKTRIVRTIQHELCHTLGAEDGECPPGAQCIMNYEQTTLNEWCNNCKNRINTYLEQRRNSQ